MIIFALIWTCAEVMVKFHSSITALPPSVANGKLCVPSQLWTVHTASVFMWIRLLCYLYNHVECHLAGSKINCIGVNNVMCIHMIHSMMIRYISVNTLVFVWWCGRWQNTLYLCALYVIMWQACLCEYCTMYVILWQACLCKYCTIYVIMWQACLCEYCTMYVILWQACLCEYYMCLMMWQVIKYSAQYGIICFGCHSCSV